MTITLTLPMVVFAVSLLIGWTAFLLGAIKWLLNRQITGLETQVAAAETKAGEAVTKAGEAFTELTNHKQAVNSEISGLRLEFSQQLVCCNHQRMEETDKLIFTKLERLQVEVGRLPDRREITNLDKTMNALAEKLGNLDGRMSGINRAVDLINEFLIEQGGKK